MALVRSWILGFAKSNKINSFFVVLARYFARRMIGLLGTKNNLPVLYSLV